jgi:hypothetical protein
MLAGDIERGMAARDGGCLPADRFVDVWYAELLRDPIGTVRKIYAHFDLPFGAAAESRMRRFLAENPQNTHGAHEYTLAAFGLDEVAERQRYRAYSSRFGL